MNLALIRLEKWNNILSNRLFNCPVAIISTSQILKFKQISTNHEKGLNGSNFITLGNISEEEKIEIIQRGFQLQAEGKISLKKYYESTDPNSLFQSKGYSIKYESIRRNTY